MAQPMDIGGEFFSASAPAGRGRPGVDQDDGQPPWPKTPMLFAANRRAALSCLPFSALGPAARPPADPRDCGLLMVSMIKTLEIPPDLPLQRRIHHTFFSSGLFAVRQMVFRRCSICS
jgi:hypothetical protein